MRQLDAIDVEMLQALADGETIRSFAAKAGRSWQALKNRLHHVRQFLGADTTPQAVAMAIRRSLIH